MSNLIAKSIVGKLSGRVVALLSCATVLAASGCGDDAGGRQAVSGTVMLKGKPVEMGMIHFDPAAGSSAGRSGRRGS